MEKMKKKFLITFIFVLLICMLVSCGKVTKAIDVDEHIAIAEKYLIEMNYEEAYTYFLEVIEVESMNVRAYLGITDAQIHLGKKEDAIEVLNKGYELTENENLIKIVSAIKNSDIDGYIALSKAYIAEGLSDKAEELLRRVYEETGDKIIGSALLLIDISNKESNDYIKLLEVLVEDIQSEDYLSVGNTLKGDEYRKLVDYINKNGTIMYQYRDTNIGVYTDGFLYCGDMIDGIRDGNGIWFDSSVRNNYEYYIGQWENDYPNGEGTLIKSLDESLIEKEPNHSYPLGTSVKGFFSNGIYNGNFTLIWNMENHTHTWNGNFIEGIVQNIDGDIFALCSDCGASLTIGNHLNYVDGFEPQ